MIISKLGEEPTQRVVAIPLTVRRRAVAVLYADSAALDSESINLEALETLVAVSGMAVEVLSVAKAAPRREEQPAATAPEPAPTYTPEREYEEQPQSETQEAMADTLRTSYMEPEPAAPVEVSPADVSEVSDEVPYYEQHVTAADEGTMMEPEPAPEIQEPAPSPTRRRYGQDQDLPVEVASDEERRLHNDARRF